MFDVEMVSGIPDLNTRAFDSLDYRVVLLFPVVDHLNRRLTVDRSARFPLLM